MDNLVPRHYLDELYHVQFYRTSSSFPRSLPPRDYEIRDLVASKCDSNPQGGMFMSFGSLEGRRAALDALCRYGATWSAAIRLDCDPPFYVWRETTPRYRDAIRGRDSAIGRSSLSTGVSGDRRGGGSSRGRVNDASGRRDGRGGAGGGSSRGGYHSDKYADGYSDSGHRSQHDYHSSPSYNHRRSRSARRSSSPPSRPLPPRARSQPSSPHGSHSPSPSTCYHQNSPSVSNHENAPSTLATIDHPLHPATAPRAVRDVAAPPCPSPHSPSPPPSPTPALTEVGTIPPALLASCHQCYVRLSSAAEVDAEELSSRTRWELGGLLAVYRTRSEDWILLFAAAAALELAEQTLVARGWTISIEREAVGAGWTLDDFEGGFVEDMVRRMDGIGLLTVKGAAAGAKVAGPNSASSVQRQSSSDTDPAAAQAGPRMAPGEGLVGRALKRGKEARRLKQGEADELGEELRGEDNGGEARQGQEVHDAVHDPVWVGGKGASGTRRKVRRTRDRRSAAAKDAQRQRELQDDT